MYLSKETALSSLLLVLFHCSLYAQVERNYNGPYRVDEFKGKAKFDYTLSGRDTVFNGVFQMRQSNLRDLLSGQDHYFSFEGAFRNNVPYGSWRFKFGEFTVDATEGLEVRDYQYKVRTNGVHHEASGDIFEGMPDGKWTQTILRINGSQAEETLFKSIIDFNKGIPQKSFHIQNERHTLMGRFLRDGLAHDVWELYSAEIPGAIESWYFSDGRLDKVLFQDNDSTTTLTVYTSEIENPQVLNLDEKYLEIVKLNQRLTADDPIEIKGEMNNLLAENAIHYRKIDNILSELGQSEFMPEFKVKVGRNTLNNNELKHLNLIKTYYIQSEGISQELLESTQLNILKLSDDEALFLLSVVNELSEKHLPLLKEVTEFYDGDILSFVPREQMLSKLWSYGELSTEIKVTHELGDSVMTRSYRGPDAETYPLEQDGIKGVYELAKYVAGCMGSVESRLKEKLTNEQRQAQLMVLEEALISEMNALNHVIDSLQGEVTGEPQKALKNVQKVAKRELSAYSVMENIEAKPDQARSLTSCFGQMQELSLTVSGLQSNVVEINVTYTDEVWNPFTATVMSEEVKKRIIEAYREVLVPYMFNELSNTLSCDNTPRLILLLENTHQRMLALREEETGRLERKLKGESDPMEVIRLFNIQTGDVLEP